MSTGDTGEALTEEALTTEIKEAVRVSSKVDDSEMILVENTIDEVFACLRRHGVI